MVVLALFECFLARGQDHAPRERRLMTASHGKTLQQHRAKREGQSGRREMERTKVGGKGEDVRVKGVKRRVGCCACMCIKKGEVQT